MKRLPLYAMAHARSGDKGDGSNVGVLAYDDRVRRHFAGIAHGDVERYEMPNLLAINFILNDSLGGGGSASLKIDAQGKTHAMALLRMAVEVPDDYEPPAVGTGGPVAPDGELSR